MILKTDTSELEEDFKRLPLKLLGFFLFHKTKTFGTIKKILNISLAATSAETLCFFDILAKNELYSIMIDIGRKDFAL